MVLYMSWVFFGGMVFSGLLALFFLAIGLFKGWHPFERTFANLVSTEERVIHPDKMLVRQACLAVVFGLIGLGLRLVSSG